jgi:RimJ/RimL family protein N-acetyltransferase
MAETARLALEPLGHQHADAIVAALDDPMVGEYLGGPQVTTVAALHERIDQLAAGPGPEWPDERWWNFVARRLDDGTVIGRVEGTTYGAWGEIAYVFAPSSWGHGFASEATHWLIDFMHGMGADELWAAVHPENLRSVRLLQRLGFAEMDAPGRPIGSFDDGDLVFRLDAPTAADVASSVTS